LTEEEEKIACKHVQSLVQHGNPMCDIPDDDGTAIFCDGDPEMPCYEEPDKDTIPELYDTCPECRGDGEAKKNHYTYKKCPECNGTGKIT
jgi:RecJ-like exonuclease